MGFAATDEDGAFPFLGPTLTARVTMSTAPHNDPPTATVIESVNHHCCRKMKCPKSVRHTAASAAE